MTTVFADTDVLAAAKERLLALYGDRLEQLLLFGSRARGEHAEDSDYDIAVFLRGYDSTMPEILRLADLSWELQRELDAVVSFKPLPSDGGGHTLLCDEIRRDGVAI